MGCWLWLLKAASFRDQDFHLNQRIIITHFFPKARRVLPMLKSRTTTKQMTPEVFMIRIPTDRAPRQAKS